MKMIMMIIVSQQCVAATITDLRADILVQQDAELGVLLLQSFNLGQQRGSAVEDITGDTRQAAFRRNDDIAEWLSGGFWVWLQSAAVCSLICD